MTFKVPLYLFFITSSGRDETNGFAKENRWTGGGDCVIQSATGCTSAAFKNGNMIWRGDRGRNRARSFYMTNGRARGKRSKTYIIYMYICIRYDVFVE